MTNQQLEFRMWELGQIMGFHVLWVSDYLQKRLPINYN